ncbi:MAG: arsenosugar biosynthesis radical SAM protein ArsS [Nitrospinota bacterium]|nr:arsenosugar biosynthesis radical SAM protein ArsS [Nitrospinota bacterium]
MDTEKDIPSFGDALKGSGLYPLKAYGITTFQINLGKRCNQACKHCHVEASPIREEMMPDDVMDICIDILKRSDIPVVDITGGAPEMHPRYREFVEVVAGMGKKILSRCNLTILFEDGYGDLPEFFKHNSVEVVASLPYFRKEETDAVRGKGVFDRSVEAIRILNGLGYGKEGTGLLLNLVFNPAGAFFPPPQGALEIDFKRELLKRHDLHFNNLYTIVNLPVGRFADYLRRTSNYRGYMQKLVGAYNPVAAENVMCRSMVSVGWDGNIYDCDFNQMLGIPVNHGAPSRIGAFDMDVLKQREIMVGPHCYGCTAGSGSSCGGATA